MSYDQWKTESGYLERDECCHEEYEIDMEGRAHCEMCSQTWWASEAEMAGQRERQIEYDSWCREEERREFWRKLTLPIRWPIFRLLEKVWPRKSLTVLTDDEIPF